MFGVQLTALSSVEKIDGVNAVVERIRDKSLILVYDTDDGMMSWKARTGWVEPDRRPLTT